MTYGVALDWLSWTYKKDCGDYEDFLENIAPHGTWVPSPSRHGYKLGFTSKNNVHIYTSPDSDRMGLHISCSGSTLRLLEQAGFTSKWLTEQVVQSGGKVTRLDLAKDAVDEKIAIREIGAMGANGKYKGSARSVQERKKSDGGYTIEIGARESDNFARLYDKAAEAGEPGDWLRAEIEMKGDVAKTMVRVLAMPDADWNAILCFKLKKMMMVDHKDYARWLEGAAIQGLPKIEKRADREQWIATQVLPAVYHYINEQGVTPATQALYWALKPYFEKVEQNDKAD